MAQKGLGIRERFPGERAKLEDQYTNPGTMNPERLYKRLVEKLGVQELLIGSPCPGAIARMLGPGLSRDVFRHLEGKVQGFGGFLKQVVPETDGGELIETEVTTDHREGLCIFTQAIGVESGH